MTAFVVRISDWSSDVCSSYLDPYPVKFRGVTRLSAWAGAANENEVSIALQIAADNRAMRGRIRDSKGEGSGDLNPTSHTRNSPSGELQICNSFPRRGRETGEGAGRRTA